MYMESIEEYWTQSQKQTIQLAQKVSEELSQKGIADHQLLDNCMVYLKNMQKMMVNLNSALGAFVELGENGEPDESYVEWLQSTVSFLQQAERNFLYLISDASDTYEGFIEKAVPITEVKTQDTITLDIGISLPNALKCKAKQINMTAKLLDAAFEKQVRKLDEPWDKVYVFYEHHVAANQSDCQIRDADNFDSKHLTDLINYYYLGKGGDGAAYVKIGNCVVADRKNFTRAVVVKEDFIDTYAKLKQGFFSQNFIV